MTASLSDASLTDLTEPLREANEEFSRLYPGETGRRQPVHTVYGGAHLFKSDSAKRLGSLARRSLDQFAPDFILFARALDLPGANQLPETISDADDTVSELEEKSERLLAGNKAAWLAHKIYERVSDKLSR